MKPIIKDVSKMESKEYLWGESFPVFTAEETDGKFNAFYKIVRKPEERVTYHKKSTENHFIVAGSGMVVVGKEKHEVSPNMSIFVPLNTPHQTIPETVMEIYVISVPPVTKEDIFQVEE